MGVVDGARAGDHHARRRVVRLDVVDEVFTLDATRDAPSRASPLDVGLGSEDGESQTTAAVSHFVQQVEGHFVLVLEHVVRLQENRAALAVHRGGVKPMCYWGRASRLGVEEDVAQDVHHLAKIFVEAPGIVYRLLSAGVTTRQWTAVPSYAFRCAPMFSISISMFMRLLRWVPLKDRCST